MIELILYAFIALAVLILAVWLVRSAHKPHAWEREQEGGPARRHQAADVTFLALGDRIFDRRDYLWLRHELSFPEAAEELARDRRQMAVEWLESLRDSFQELIRTPEPAAFAGRSQPEDSSWRLLWMTLRFHFVLNYALFIVRFFSPYHQLIPRLQWVGSLRNLVTGSEGKHPVRDSVI